MALDPYKLIDNDRNGEQEEEEEKEKEEEEKQDGENEEEEKEDWVEELGQLSRRFSRLFRGRQQNVTADLTEKRYSGYLHQKGTFQFQRRFCALCGTRFLCCKSEKSLKVVVEVNVREYEVVHQERREGKTSSYPHELRFSCPGKETYLFYTETRQSAEEWVKELRRVAAVKQDSLEASADVVDSSSLADDADRQSENGETNISGGSIEKTKSLNQNLSEDVRKKSKLKAVLGTFGKKLGNKTKNFLQAIDFSNPQAVEAEQEFGHVSIHSEEFTGDRWFRRFCRIENGQLNCYTDQSSTDVRPEFSLGLHGAQLKPLEGKDELKIILVKDGKEHSLKMSDFMHHGRWLMALIRETGFANQLASKSSCDKSIYEQTALYEELQPFITLDGVTEDDTNLEEPPPLPTASPPSSPLAEPENSRGLQSLNGASNKKSDPEGIYLQPAEWLKDLEELKKKRKPLNVVPCPMEEESTYINRDFARKALNTREKAPKKEIRTEKGSINTSSSYPNLTFVGITTDGGAGSGANRNEAPRDITRANRLADRQPVAGGRTGKFRPSSALVESLENLIDCSESSGRRNGKALSAAGQKKSDDNFSKANSKIKWDELLKNNRSRTISNEAKVDLKHDADHNKNMVLNLVQMFEKKT